MTRAVCNRGLVALERVVASVAEETIGEGFVEDFELGVLRLAAGAVVVFLLFGGLVQVGYFLGEVEDAVLDGVDGEVVVDVVVVSVDWAGGVDLYLLTLLAGRYERCCGGYVRENEDLHGD